MILKSNKKDPRKATFLILSALDKNRITIDKALEDINEKGFIFSKQDKALFHTLVYGILRWRNRLDWIIKHFSKIRLNKIDSNVLNVLRLGVFQIVYLNKVPVSASVNTSVEIAKSFGALWITRFVNAVLRNIAKGYKNISFPDIDKNPVEALSVKKSFPKWIIQRWLNRFGLQQTIKICDSINIIPPITARTNALCTTREKLISALEHDVKKIKRTEYSSEGICFSKLRISIASMQSFQNGWFNIQNEASQLVSYLLNPQPKDTILDACAGLGGKTGHIAQLMKNQGLIVAIDKHKHKLTKLETEMNRLGISIVKTRVYDLLTTPFCLPSKTIMFDRILLDAPCSGLGVLRKNPDAKWMPLKKNLKYYKKIQEKMLDNLASLVKPSGILVYSVCSMEPEENEEVAENFLGNHPEFIIENRFQKLPHNAKIFVNKSGYFKTFPHINDMDGFFTVRFKRVANL